MNLVCFHGFMEKPNSTVVLNFQSYLVNYYLAKQFVIIDHNYKQLSSFPNDVKLRIHAIDKQKKDFVMACTTEISSIVNTKRKFHIQSPLHFPYQKTYIMINQRLWINCFITNISPY